MHFGKRHAGEFLAARLVCAALVGCGSDDTDDEPRPGLSSGQIAHVLRTANTEEIAQAQAAEPRLTHAGAKDFAALMLTQHGASNDELSALVESLGIVEEDNMVSGTLEADSQSVVMRIEQASDTDVDRVYIDDQVMVHETVLAIVDMRLLPDARDAQLTAFLQTLRMHVDVHLGEAQRIESEISAVNP